METVRLSVIDPMKPRRIVAKTLTSGVPDDRLGNIETDQGTELVWEAVEDKSVVSFTVQFFELGSKNAIWPFKGTDHGPNYSLVVKPGKSESRTLKAGYSNKKLKYAVAAEHAPGADRIDPLDPMLIIRPPLISKVTFGLVCALAGAVVGALLALRPWQ
jgi:hypothetical protein